MHYEKKQKDILLNKRAKSLGKCAQIEKISNYLLKNISSFTQSYLSYIHKCRYEHRLKEVSGFKGNASIKDRVYNQKLIIQDSTDIIKSSAKAMEGLSKVRDGSKSSKYKNYSGKGYMIEGCILYIQNKIIPLLFTFFKSEKDIEHSSKDGMIQNINTLKQNNLLEDTWHLLDRGYDASWILRYYTEQGLDYIIRAVRNRNATSISYFKKAINTYSTHMELNNLFEPIESYKKRMIFHSHTDYPWIRIAWEKVYRKGETYPKNPADITEMNLLVVEIIDKKVKGAKEDLHGLNTDSLENTIERDMYIWTNIPIKTIDDALVIFLCYLKRWKIETFFYFLKQTFELERICIMKLEKIKNLCSLLMIAANHFYESFKMVPEQKIKDDDFSLENVMEKNDLLIAKPKHDNPSIVSSKKIITGLQQFYTQYCHQKGLTENINSYAKFIKHEIGDTIVYILQNPFNNSS